MEVFVIDQIIAHLEENPSADPIQVLNDYKVVATDQVEQAFVIGSEGYYDKKRCMFSHEYMRNHFNLDV